MSGLFERLSVVDDDGETVRITPHQIRHYMTTLANEGHLSQLDIAKWAGRRDIRHHEYYDHETAVASQEFNSEIWLSRQSIELARLRDLVALIDDETVQTGAILRLNDDAHHAIGHQPTGHAGLVSAPSARPNTTLPPQPH